MSRNLFLFGLALFICRIGWGGHEQPAHHPDTNTVYGVVDTLYRAVSFAPGDEPDWELLGSLFFEGAVFAQPARGSQDVELWPVDQFIQSFKDDLVTYEMKKTGFWERVAGTTCSSFGLSLIHI